MAIDVNHPSIPVSRQCQLLGLSRSSVYYRPRGDSALNEQLMRLIDQQYLARLIYGAQRMTVHLRQLGYTVNVKRVRRLMRLMGLEVVYPKPRLSQRNPQHKVYGYLLRDLLIDRCDQVWASDITYIPLHRGWAYLVAIMDWFSRFVLSWELSVTADASFCVSALERTLMLGTPEIFNSDQGSQSHLDGIHRCAGGRGCADQHGWARPSLRQHLRRAAVAKRQVRGGVPARLPDANGGGVWAGALLQVLQLRASPSGIGLADAC